MMRKIKIVLIGALAAYLILINMRGPASALEPPEDAESRLYALSILQQPAEEPVTRDSLTLAQCVELALENNPRIGYRNEEIKRIKAGLDQAAGRRWPSFRGIGAYSRFSDTQRMAPPRRSGYPLIYAENVLSGSVVMSLPLFTGGRITHEVAAYEYLQQSAEHRLAYTRQELIFDVTSVCCNILKQRQIVKSLEFSRSALDRQRRMVKDLIAAKKAAEVDRLRIEVRLADIQQKIEQEKNHLFIQNRILANLMGLEQTGFFFSHGAARSAEADVNLEQCLDRAYANRADYLAVQKEVDAQSRRVKAARAAYLPSVSVYGSYSAKQAVGSYIKAAGADGLEDIGQLGCVFEIPLFEGGKITAEVSREQAILASLKERRRELALEIRLEVESAIYNLNSTGKRIAVIEKAIEQADESLRIEMEKYNLGKGSVMDILDAEAALLEARTSHTVALADRDINIVRLRFAQGQAHQAF